MSENQWHGVLVARGDFNPEFVRTRDRLADGAKRGDWDTVFAIIDSGDAGVNDWRIGGGSWFSPLHQAAWLGASTNVATALIERGAWTTLRDAEGRRPVDVARERRHEHLIDMLTPLAHDLSVSEIEAFNARLAELVMDATRQACAPGTKVRHFDVTNLAESDQTVWFPIPGMVGGFVIALFRRRLHVESWSRVVGGSGRAYVITRDHTTLVDEGFV